MRVLAIGAHPDDIEIACAGTLAKCVKRGDTVIVCHVSSGDLGHVIIPPDQLSVIRAKEAKEAGVKLAVGGKGMLLWQGAAAYKLYTGLEMPTDEYQKFQAENEGK